MKDLTNQTFGQLRVIKLDHRNLTRMAYYLCKCTCGNEKIIRSDNLRNGNSKSCGCLKIAHGYTGSRTYSIWCCMRERCNNPNYRSYPYYGGRGIQICPRWEDFNLFLQDMGEAPSGKSLDRYPNNNGNYEPSNCRWATKKEQANNTRRNIYFDYEGRKLTLAQLSELKKIPRSIIERKLIRGYTIDEALQSKDT